MTEQNNSQQGVRFLVIAAALVIIIEERSIVRPEKSLRRIDRENCTWAVQAAVQNSACTIDKKNVGNAAYSR